MPPPDPSSFKGIALFTPAGDLIYCIDPEKRKHWHSQLCAVLQDVLGLAEPPHFLVPCYTATIDRWLDPRTHQLQTVAEASPLVMRHQALLNVLFGVEISWQAADRPEGVCEPLVLESYRSQFPELWQEHDLVMQFQPTKARQPGSSDSASASALNPISDGSAGSLSWSPLEATATPQGYVLRLFVAGSSAATERILYHLHQLLERSLHHPYTLKVIDIYKHPDQAEANQITATPTLVKAFPLPVRRIVGDLEDADRVLQILF
jgi:circadian clock protein KaiB